MNRSGLSEDGLDAPTYRDTQAFRVTRANGDGEVTLEGYASTFEPYEMYGGPAMGGWIEQIDRNAFDKTLRAKPDLHLLINHEGMPLARTKSGTLKLSVDDSGLKVTATLDRSDPDVQRLEPKMRRKDMDEMSFAFRVIKQRWDYAPDFEDDPNGLRVIEEVNLSKGDVSVVNFGANPTTGADLRSHGRRKTLTLTDALAMSSGDIGRRRKTLKLADALVISSGDVGRRRTGKSVT